MTKNQNKRKKKLIIKIDYIFIKYILFNLIDINFYS